MIVPFDPADPTRQEQRKSVAASARIGAPEVRPQPFDEAGARPDRTRSGATTRPGLVAP